MKRIKVACFGVKAIPYTGGIENVLTNTAPILAKRGYDISIYVRANYTKRYFKTTDFYGVRVISLPCIPGKRLEAPSHTIISIIHAVITGHDLFFFHGVVLGFFTVIPRLIGKRVVLQTHGLDWKREKWGWFASRIIRLAGAIAARVPHLTFCVGKEDARYFETKYKKTLPVVFNGINSAIKSDSRDYLRLQGLKECQFFLFMSRLVPEKGCHLLVEAWEQVDPNIKNNMKLAIAGDTNYRDSYYHKLVSRGNHDTIFLGFVDGEHKQQLLSNAAAYIQPSTIEGHSVALLEAMSYGLFTVVSDDDYCT